MSEDSYQAYSNFHEKIAISNLFNMNINIFTNGPDIPVPRWTNIQPNVIFKRSVSDKPLHDLNLYHSNENHFDLLLSKNDAPAKNSMDGQKDVNGYDEIDMEEFDEERTHLLKKETKSFKCEQCEAVFISKYKLFSHISKVHEDVDEWNCNDCSFQANNSTSLMNHLKISSHQPSEGNVIKISEIFKCKDCDSEFTNYPSMMKHRKENHNHNKICRYYLKDKCMFSADICWYMHSKNIQPSGKKPILKCTNCDMDFTELNKLMFHKESVQNINKVCKNI